MRGDRVFSFNVVIRHLLFCLFLFGETSCLLLPKSESPGDDGRVSLFLDVDPSRINASIVTQDIGGLGPLYGTVRIRYRVGDEDPVNLIVTWSADSASKMSQAGITFIQLTPPLTRFDLVGKRIPGGTKVFVRITENFRNPAEIEFKVDGNVELQLGLLNPALYSDYSDWVLERIQ